MKQYFIIFMTLALFVAPTSVHADDILCPAPTGNQVFNPNSQIPSGYGAGNNSFGGLNFSGVGGAVTSCANIGGGAVNGLRDLFNIKNKGTTGNSIPVNDSAANTELAKANTRENCYNAVAYAVSKIALQKVSDKTLNWVKTGFNGNPFYVRDIDSYLKSVGDEKIADFLSNVPNTDPIFGIALRSTITQQITGQTDGRINQLMDTPEARAYQDFQSDFTKGGWGAMLNMNNNPIGAYFNAVDSLSMSTNTAKQNVRNELQQGSGFLSMRKCAEYAGASTVAQNGLSNQACRADYQTKKNAELNACNSQADPILKSSCISTINLKYVTLLNSCDSVNVNTTIPSSAPRCLRYEVVTPGEIIAKQTSSILESPTNQLIAADSINEFLGGFFDTLLNGLFSGGLGSTGSQFRSNSGAGPGSNTVIGTSGATLPSVAEAQNALGYQTSCTNGYSGDFDISRPQQLRAVIQTQKNYFNRIADSAVVISNVVPSLGKLDYCLPGPNPTWEKGLAENYNTFTSSFQTETRTINIPVLSSLTGTTKTSIKFIARPSLFDKTKDTYQEIRNWEFTGDASATIGGFGISGQNINSLYGFFRNGYNLLLSNYKDAFTQDKIVNAFTAVVPASQQATARGNIIDSLKETESLPGYAQIIPQYETYYSQSKDQVSQNLIELEAINAEVLKIVATAKARYIKERAQANNPVNQQCLDRAYVIDIRPINGDARKQSDTVNPDVQFSKDASAYFYTTL